jgi:multidrug efflux pump subunit AcrB
VRPKLLSIPDAFALSFDPPSVNGLGATGGFEFEVEDFAGAGSAALNDATQAVIAAARQQPELNPQSLFTRFLPRPRSSSTTSTGRRRSCSA